MMVKKKIRLKNCERKWNVLKLRINDENFQFTNCQLKNDKIMEIFFWLFFFQIICQINTKLFIFFLVAVQLNYR